MSILVQEAGFEPANRYGLGPHPSAFDQAGRLLQYASLIKRIYQHIRGCDFKLFSTRASIKVCAIHQQR